MRIIYRASLVFLLKDIYSKLPITSAVILCNGKQNPYTRKKDGHYVFSNLYPGKYEVDISCKGYNPLKFYVDLKENETKIINSDLSYSPDNQNISNVTRFEITCIRKKQALANIPIDITLQNAASFMKLLEPIKAGSDEVKLNVEMLTSLLGQNYVYEIDKKKYDLYLWSYNQESKCYILKDVVNEEIKPGGLFYPKWQIRSDSMGRAIMPLMGQFMKDDEITFKCISENLRCKVSFNVKGRHQSGEVFYEKGNFRKIPERKK